MRLRGLNKDCFKTFPKEIFPLFDNYGKADSLSGHKNVKLDIPRYNRLTKMKGILQFFSNWHIKCDNKRN